MPSFWIDPRKVVGIQFAIKAAHKIMFTSHSVFQKSSKARQIGVAAVMLAVASMCGCQRAVRRFAGNAASGVVDRVIAQPSSTVELLEAELRWMEDNLYQLDDELDAVILQLDSARRDNAILRLELAEARGEKRTTAITTPSANGTTSEFDYSEEIDLSPPVIVDQKSVLRRGSGANEPDQLGAESLADDELNANIEYGTPTLAPEESRLKGSPESIPAKDEEGDEANGVNLESEKPTGNTGDESSPQSVAPESESVKDEVNSDAVDGVRLEAMPEPKFLPPSEPIEIPKPDPFESRFKSYENELRSVQQIKLNPKLTGGYDFDDVPGHEGVMVVIEPQNKDSLYVPVTGVVSVEVKDLSKPGVAGRVGKWTFDPIEAQKHLRKTAFGNGVHLELPWPSEPPKNQELQLLVQLQLADGRTLSTTKKILVEPQIPTRGSHIDAVNNRPWSPNRPSPTESQTPRGFPATSQARKTRWVPER